MSGHLAFQFWSMPTKTERAENWAAKSADKHSGKFDYSLAVGEYRNLSSKVTIVCPIHGTWRTLAHNHLHLGTGCPACAGVKKLTHDEWLERAIETHGADRYEYLSEYQRAHSPVTIRCDRHDGGFVFQQSARDHASGDGCPKCSGQRTNTDDWIRKARAKHGDRYDYSAVAYTGAKNSVTIICHRHDQPHRFSQIANNHLRGHGCAACSGRVQYVPPPPPVQLTLW